VDTERVVELDVLAAIRGGDLEALRRILGERPPA
jgi:hypothetical protein